MEISAQEIKRFVEQSDMVLVGIGEEFERKNILEHDEAYMLVCKQIKEAGAEWVMPYVDTFWLAQKEDMVTEALQHLKQLLEGKNYFVVSTCMNGFLQKAGFKEDRIVEPCGGYVQLQCADGCEGTLEKTDEKLFSQIEACCKGEMSWTELNLPECAVCKKQKVFNSLYAEKYLEEGYLPQWNIYMKWLQGTLKHNLCILELGVGMKYPSVIRWPFEKTAYFNKKAVFVRMHERLYQLTEELKEQGYCLSQNAVEFFYKKI